MIITIVGLISVLGVIVGFVVAGGMAVLSSGSEQRTAAHCASLFGRAIMLGSVGALVGEAYLHSSFGMPFDPTGALLGWIGGVNVVFLREAVHRWWLPRAAGIALRRSMPRVASIILNAEWNPRRAGRAVRRGVFWFLRQVNRVGHRHAE